MASPSQKYHGVQTPAYTPGRRFLNANANGSRVGYVASNAEHMKRVDEALTNFVKATQGQLMSPNAPSWRRGERGAKLDHLVTWNLSHDSCAGSLGCTCFASTSNSDTSPPPSVPLSIWWRITLTKATPKPTHERHNARTMGSQSLAPPLTLIQHLID